MRVVIQRVSHASVTIDGHCKSAIQKGMMILVGIEETDSRGHLLHRLRPPRPGGGRQRAAGGVPADGQPGGYRLVMQENRKSPYF